MKPERQLPSHELIMSELMMPYTASAGICHLVKQAQKIATVNIAAEVCRIRHHQLGHDEFMGR